MHRKRYTHKHEVNENGHGDAVSNLLEGKFHGKKMWVAIGIRATGIALKVCASCIMRVIITALTT